MKDKFEILYGLTYDEYIEMKSNDESLRFEFSALFSNESMFLKGWPKTFFNLSVMSYMVVPIIAVSIISYKFGNWYLLFGALLSYLSTFLEIKIRKNIYAYCIFCSIFYLREYGFHLDDYGCLFGLCIFWGSIFYYIAISIEDGFAKDSIIDNPQLFNDLSKKKIIVFGKYKK